MANRAFQEDLDLICARISNDVTRDINAAMDRAALKKFSNRRFSLFEPNDPSPLPPSDQIKSS
jgi:hypothetical protein